MPFQPPQTPNLLPLLLQHTLNQRAQEDARRQSEEDIARRRADAAFDQAVQLTPQVGWKAAVSGVGPDFPTDRLEFVKGLDKALKARQAENTQVSAAQQSAPNIAAMLANPNLQAQGGQALQQSILGLQSRPELLPLLMQQVGQGRDINLEAQRQAEAEKQAAQQEKLATERRAEGRKIATEGRAYGRDQWKNYVETGAAIFATGDQAQIEEFGKYASERVDKDSGRLIRDAQIAGLALIEKQSQERSQGPGAQFFAKVDSFAKYLARGHGDQWDPNNPAMVRQVEEDANLWASAPSRVWPDLARPGHIFIGNADDQSKRAYIVVVDQSLDAIENLMSEIETNPAAAAQVSGVVGAKPFQSLRRLSAAQEPLVASLDSELRRTIRSVISTSDESRPSDFDVNFFIELLPLLTEIIDPRTGKVSASALARVQSLRRYNESVKSSGTIEERQLLDRGATHNLRDHGVTASQAEMLRGTMLEYRDGKIDLGEVGKRMEQSKINLGGTAGDSGGILD